MPYHLQHFKSFPIDNNPYFGMHWPHCHANHSNNLGTVQCKKENFVAFARKINIAEKREKKSIKSC